MITLLSQFRNNNKQIIQYIKRKIQSTMQDIIESVYIIKEPIVIGKYHDATN